MESQHVHQGCHLSDVYLAQVKEALDQGSVNVLLKHMQMLMLAVCDVLYQGHELIKSELLDIILVSPHGRDQVAGQLALLVGHPIKDFE